MDASFFYRPDHDFNQLPPEREQRRGGALFWSFCNAMFKGEELPAPADDGADWRLAAMRRREQRIRELNGPKAPGPLTAIVGDLVDDAKRAMVKVARVTKTAQAVEWLRQVTEQGSVPQTEIEARGRERGLSLKVLKGAKLKAGVISTRKGFPYWVWRRLVVKVPNGAKE